MYYKLGGVKSHGRAHAAEPGQSSRVTFLFSIFLSLKQV